MISVKRPCVIAAVRSQADFEAALCGGELIFDLTPNINTVAKRAQMAHDAGKKLFLHMDLAEGIGKDQTGVEFVRSQGADGIISTRAGMIRMAKEAGLVCVQRFFVIDSQSLHSTKETLKNTKADMIEIMPGLLPKVIAGLCKVTDIPIIAGGMVETRAEAAAAFAAGAAAVSTGKQELWEKELI